MPARAPDPAHLRAHLPAAFLAAWARDTQGSTRDDMANLAHFTEFNDLIGFEKAITTEERFMRRCVRRARIRARMHPGLCTRHYRRWGHIQHGGLREGVRVGDRARRARRQHPAERARLWECMHAGGLASCARTTHMQLGFAGVPSCDTACMDTHVAPLVRACTLVMLQGGREAACQGACTHQGRGPGLVSATTTS